MSRRKQPNPKPLKCGGDESWNEAEDGDGNSEKKIKEESDCPSSPATCGLAEMEQNNYQSPIDIKQEPYQPELHETNNDMGSKNMEGYKRHRQRDSHQKHHSESNRHNISSKGSRSVSGGRRSDKSGDRGSSADKHTLLWSQPKGGPNNQLNLNKLNHAQQQQLVLMGLGRNESSRSRSSDAPDLGEVDISEAEDGDEQRRKVGSRSSRSRTPDIPSSELNGSPGPFSHQQMLQVAAGLPYFHLLPPAIRNDAARYLFVPPVLPGTDLAASNTTGPNSGTGSVTPISTKSEKTIPTGENIRSGPAYMCEPCNIKFSSARTLEAHQTYYCSFRKDNGKEGEKSDADGDSKGDSTLGTQISTGGGKKRERESSGEERELTIDESAEVSRTASGLSTGASDPATNNPNKNIKTGKLYSCIHCSYSADKKVSLNRHMRMHSGPPISAIQLSNNSNDEQGPSVNNSNSNSSNVGANKNLPEGVNALERYCHDCEIQFSSIKTYRVHKQYYCSTRHVLKAQQATVACATGVSGPQIKQQGVEIGGGITVTPIRKTSGSPLPPEGSPISTPGPMPPQPFVILPTNPVIIVPYCFIQGASILPGNVLPSQNALVVSPNGSVHGLPATVMPMPMPPPSPSPSQSIGGGIQHFMHNFSASGNNSNSLASTSNNVNANSNSLSPNSQSHSVFNDPKDVIRKMCSVPRNASNSTESTHSEPGVGKSHQQHRRHSSANNGGASRNAITRSSVSAISKENDEMGDTDGDLEADADGETYTDGGMCDESMPAIDLTLRSIQPKKERISADEEKENREVALSRSSSGHGQIPGGGNSNGTTPSLAHLADFHRDRELSSPSERLSVGSGSGSGGKRTPRPSSTSISSSCSTPPALCEPKMNGILSRGSPSSRERDDSSPTHGINLQVNNKNAMMMMMMNANVNNSVAVNCKKGVDYSVLEMSKLRGGGGSGSISGGKMSPIATQLPGGAILTSATSQSLAELLMSNPPELNESLAKLNPQVLLNSRSAAGSPLGLNLNFPSANMFSGLTPELAMRFLEPTYLATLQHTLQQQQQSLAQQQQQQQQNQQQQQVPAKRGVSKCHECDIVFYKYENYLAHKEHYCAARATNTTVGGSIAANLKSSSRESLHGGKETQSRMSSCSSPARSIADVEESLSPLSGPTPMALNKKSSGSSASTRSQSSSNFQRKSPDSSIEIVIPIDPLAVNTSKSKSKSPVAITTPLSVSPASSPKVGKEVTHSKEKSGMGGGGGQYPCLQCGVKYSTLDNLQTHQAFYCTKRLTTNYENNNNSCGETGAKTVMDGKTNNNSNTKGFFKCGKCKLSIPEDQMNSHSRVCNGANGPSSGSSVSGTGGSTGGGIGLKCPCCEVHSPTVSAAQKHLETHSGIGIRAFKCLLCGYRGNTLRGMRTHIRMHFDKRVSDLQEGEYITCITSNDLEQNTVPSTPTRATGSATAQVTLTVPSPERNHMNVSPNRAELEKEPERLYHSPRSGKGSTASSSGPLSPAEMSDLKNLGVTASNVGDKVENNNRLHFCHLCNYSSSYKGNVVRHMKLVHKISEESADEIVTAAALATTTPPIITTTGLRSPPEESNGADSRDSNSNSKCSTDFISSVSISLSSAKAAASAAVNPQHHLYHQHNHSDSSSHSSSSAELNSTPVSDRNSLPAPDTNSNSAKNGNITNNGGSPVTRANNKNSGAAVNVNGIGGTGNGGESHSGNETESNETRKCSSRSSSDEDLGSLTTLQKEKSCAEKYCKPCGIYFKFIDSFVAHKKHYCPGFKRVSSSDAPEVPERAETPVQ